MGVPRHDHVDTAVVYAPSDRRAHLGLGPGEVIRELRIGWPSGRVRTIAQVPVDQQLDVREDEAALPSGTPPTAGP